MNKTIIYYTANRENPAFEKKVTDNILAVKGDIPVISVSQKPMDFGQNICVGNVGHSYVNAFRQLLIGCKAAKTDYVFTCEADCFYPPGYFDFKPKKKTTIYTYDNVWMLWKKETMNRFFHKEQTHGSLIYGRKYLIKFLEKCLKGLPEWTPRNIKFPFYDESTKFEIFTGLPIVNVKTGDSMNVGTRVNYEKPRLTELEYWGKISDLKKRLFDE